MKKPHPRLPKAIEGLTATAVGRPSAVGGFRASARANPPPDQVNGFVVRITGVPASVEGFVADVWGEPSGVGGFTARVTSVPSGVDGFMAKVIGSVNPDPGGVGGDTTPPTTPGSVQASATSATTGSVTWTASTDNVAVVGYEVFIDGSPIDTTTALSYSLTNLSPSTQYSITVTAFDSAGNNSPAGGPALFTTDSNSAPVWALGNQAFETGEAVNIDFDSVVTDADGDVVSYTLFSGTLPSGLALSGARNQTLSGTVDTVETQICTFTASDGIANPVQQAITFTITAPDTTAPAAPTGLVISTIDSSSINLNWVDSLEPDLATYTVYRSTDGTNFGVRQSGLTTSDYFDSGLSSSTQYWYYVTATDDSGNESAASSTVTDTTPVSALPVYAPNKFVTISATGSGDGSQGNPWTLQQAMANATAGDTVQIGPGTYVATASSVTHGGDARWNPSFNPAGVGTQSQPIIFFAQNRAGLTYQEGVTTRLTHTGGTGPYFGCGGRTVATPTWITWDGIFIQEEAGDWASDTGPIVIWGNENCSILSCVLYGLDIPDGSEPDNHVGIRVEDADGTTIRDCHFEIGGGGGPGNSHNNARIQVYTSSNWEVSYCTFKATSTPIFIKSTTSAGQGRPKRMDNIRIHHNWVDGSGHNGGLSQGFDISDTPGSSPVGDRCWIYQNVLINCTAEAFTQSETSLGNIFTDGLWICNNTIYNCRWFWSLRNPTFAPSDSVFSDHEMRNNIVHTVDVGFFDEIGGSTVAFMTSMGGSHNTYHQVTDFSSDSTPAVAALTPSFEPNSLTSDPLFENVGAEDFTLQAGSPALNSGVDFLNLLGGGTSAPINRGAYILPDQSDQIGRRAPSVQTTATFIGNFDSGTLGTAPTGSDGFFGGNTNNSPNPAEYDNTRSVSGSQSAKITATAGSVWFGITGMPIPGGNLSEGDEIWLQIKQYIPTGFDFTVTQGGSNSVKWFNFAPSVGTARVYWNFGEEFGNVIRMDSEAQDPGHTDITYTIPRDQWVTYEIYMLVTTTSFGATPTMRIWADHVFLGESFERTLGGGVIDEFRVGDYWNDTPTGSPATQSFWLDDLVIFNSVAGDIPSNFDSGGRRFIGNVG